MKFWSGLAAVSFMPVTVFAGPVAPVIMGTVAGACGLIALTASARTDLGATLEGNQYSWLYRVQKGLQPTTLVTQIADAAKAFLYPH